MLVDFEDLVYLYTLVQIVEKRMKNGKKNSVFFSSDRFYSHFTSVLGHFFGLKKTDAQCYDQSFCIPEFFFV